MLPGFFPRIVEMAEQGAARLADLGYSNVSLLSGGLAAWREAGYEVFSGVNVPSKAFGEFVEITYGTPRLPAEEVKAMADAGADMVILDSRPFDEDHRMNIPGGVGTPGAELVHRRARALCGFPDGPEVTVQDLIAERYRGIRPAPGYPAQPDHSEKPTLWQILGVEAAVGIRLTESFAMDPAASVSGLLLTTEAMVAEMPKEEAPPMPDMGGMGGMGGMM